MFDDEADGKRARWLFNIVVFLFLFAFTIDLSYMLGSLIPVGIGACLIAWGVWRTPEITDPISARMGCHLRRSVENVVISLGPALILSGASILVTSGRYPPQLGFPFDITRPIPNCFGPGIGDCYTYDSTLVSIDYLFWLGLSFSVLTLARWVRTRCV
jgi:hypothetical protein